MIVYKITNNINGKVYIGQTIRTLEERWKAHCMPSSGCLAIARAIQKYSKENFSIEAIDKANTKNELNNKEMYWISFYNSVENGYNCTYGGEGLVASDYVKRKISTKLKGKKYSEERKRQMSETSKVRFADKRNHPRYGKKLNGEQRKRLSDAHKGYKHTYEQKKKISLSNGKKVINIDTNTIFNSAIEAKNYYKIPGNHISEVCRGKRKTCGGYRWRYYDENHW